MHKDGNDWSLAFSLKSFGPYRWSLLFASSSRNPERTEWKLGMTSSVARLRWFITKLLPVIYFRLGHIFPVPGFGGCRRNCRGLFAPIPCAAGLTPLLSMVYWRTELPDYGLRYQGYLLRAADDATDHPSPVRGLTSTAVCSSEGRSAITHAMPFHQ